jgi:hypothetical protein
MKGVNRINVFLQFICLVCCWLFELTLLLINIKYTVDYPAFEALFVYIPWLVYGNCYFVVFYRQSGILLPRKLYYFCWIFLIIINAVGFYDVYLTYMQYTVSTDYYDLTTIFDFILSVMFLFIEFVVNIYIIIRIFNKVRHQSNHHYKILVAKLCSFLFLYFCLDVMLMTFDITNNQMYGYFFWSINYCFKIQMEALCLGKIKEVIIIMENYQNA